MVQTSVMLFCEGLGVPRLQVEDGQSRLVHHQGYFMMLVRLSCHGFRHFSSHAREIASVLALSGAVFCSAAPASAAEVNAGVLRATVASISAEGDLCPPDSIATSLSEDGATATVLFSKAVAGLLTTGCKVSLEIDVPAGLSIGIPTSVIHGFSTGGATVSRSYSFEGASGSQQLSESVNEDFVLVESSSDPRSPTCGGASQRVTYVIDVAGALLSEDTFFQIDAIDVDTSFRFGTSWASCDASDPLQVAPSQPGEFCDGPNQQPCAEGLQCDRESAPNNAEGTCFVP
jgi:uncharacterized protein DUF4360